MTLRLYYDDPYLASFTSVVTSCDQAGERWALKLDQSAFYPTSGGQPYDKGLIGDAQVLEVIVDSDGDMTHYTDRPVEPGTAVSCSIDWGRRFDHMQQHAGEHLLANALFRLFHGKTIGLHIGAEFDSIDADMPGAQMHLSDDEISLLEDDVNQRIWRDVPVRQWFPSPEELSELPLRKPPSVKEHVRVVQIGDEEFCACGGTHPDTAGQIGMIRVISALPARGKMRLTFVCGKRAYEYLRRSDRIVHKTAAQFSAGIEDLVQITAGLQQEMKETKAKLSAVRKQLLLGQKNELLRNAEKTAEGKRIVVYIADADPDSARELANALCVEGISAAIIGVRSQDTILWCVVSGKESGIDAGCLLRTAAKNCGGKGGGSAEFARGSGPERMLEEMRGILGIS